MIALTRYIPPSLAFARGVLLAVLAGVWYAAGYVVGVCLRLLAWCVVSFVAGLVAATGWNSWPWRARDG